MTRANKFASAAFVIGSLPILASLPARAAEEGGAAMPQLDFSTYPSQLFWLAVTFVVLFVLMWKVALPRVGDVIDMRDKKIAADLEAAEAAKQDIEKISAEIDEVMAAARSDAQDVLRKAAEKVAADHAKKQDKLDAELAAKTAEAEANIAKATNEAVAGLRDVAEEVAASSVEKLTGRAAAKKELSSALDAVSGKGA